MTTDGQPLLSTDPDVDARAWQFLTDASKVSFGAMTSLTSPAPGAVPTDAGDI